MTSSGYASLQCFPGTIRQYSVCVGRDVLDVSATAIAQLKPGVVFVLSDTTVWELHGIALLASFERNCPGLRILVKTIPPGEPSKSRKTKESVEDYMLANGCHRDTVVVGFGGGVVGDIAGFVASTFHRGVPIIHIPTTLLAMVDSSVGGKTGVDTRHGKNLIGTFHQPRGVFVSVNLLSTLSRREFANGMAEVIKVATTHDEALFHTLHTQADALMKVPCCDDDYQLLIDVITRAIDIKLSVVSCDEREAGLRSVLNAGHTVGHALEALLQPRLLHGECVSVGLVLEAEAARHMRLCDATVPQRLIACLSEYNLPVKVPTEVYGIDNHMSLLRQYLFADKKNASTTTVATTVNCALLSRIGTVCGPPYTISVQLSLLERLLSQSVTIHSPVSIASTRHVIRVPGSKSLSNRALLLASLCSEPVTIHGLLQSDDTQVMMAFLQRVGVGCEWVRTTTDDSDSHTNALIVIGTGGKFTQPLSSEPAYLGNAGTAARFLTSLCCLLPDKDKFVDLCGNSRMHERPIAPLVDCLRALGGKIEYLGTVGCLPLRVYGGGLRGGSVTMESSVSSQFTSSVLMIAPYCQSPLRLTLSEDKPTSLPYIHMTIDNMKSFGVDVTMIGMNEFIVNAPSSYTATSFVIEPDASSATYPLALAALTGVTVVLPHLGNTSTQGDAKFCEVLASMGCHITQTDTCTTVTGPPTIDSLTAITIDMSTMTDAFLALCVVASLARGVTVVTGISNQRVKECDRIHAMVTELTKVGVVCEEFPDGLRITGSTLSALREHVTTNGGAVHINCYNDHRIAMSFAVLGCVVPGIIITDQRCVEKTYPEFWDDVSNVFGVSVVATDGVGTGNVPVAARSHNDASVVLIGMRGAGKTFLGRYCASQLGWQHVDVDDLIQIEAKASIRDIIETEGWDGFRRLESAMLKKTLTKCPQRTVISCGGGVVESRDARELLKCHWPVVWIRRSVGDIEEDIVMDSETRPVYPGGLTFEAVYHQRVPWYSECSTHMFHIVTHDREWPRIQRDFVKFIDNIGVVSSTPTASLRLRTSTAVPSCFLSLTCPDLRSFVPAVSPSSASVCCPDGNVLCAFLNDVTVGVDSVEIRVDKLSDGSVESVLDHISIIRRHTPEVKIIVTVRSVGQGGCFSGTTSQLMEILTAAMACGVEFIDVESNWDPSVLRSLFQLRSTNYPTTRFIVSHHITTLPHPRIEGVIEGLSQLCRVVPSIDSHDDVVKFVTTAGSVEDVMVLREGVRQAKENGILESVLDSVTRQPHLIVLCMGECGVLSRVLCEYMCPVTHASLPTVAAPGQLSVSQIRSLQHQLGILPSKRFYLFGHGVTRSLSPVIHNTGFQHHALPYNYDIHDCTSIDDVVAVLQSREFGGGSVTIPFKEAIIPHMTALTPQAQAIGAVNTIIKLTDGSLLGHNTDWIGILTPLSSALNSLNTATDSRRNVLVLGAGGTARAVAYAVSLLPYTSLFIHNRTVDKAVALASEFSGCVLSSLALLDDVTTTCGGEVHAIISTLPASAYADGSLLAQLRPLLTAYHPVVFDVLYRPLNTPLCELARECGCVHVIHGLAMLLHQGFAQFECWTQVTAPTRHMTLAATQQLVNTA